MGLYYGNLCFDLVAVYHVNKLLVEELPRYEVLYTCVFYQVCKYRYIFGWS